MKFDPPKTRTVLITGCSTGIGLATALMLRGRGWQVIPTARKSRDLEMLTGKGFTPVTMDVADEGSVARGVEACLELTGGRLGGVVNNAGVAQYGAVEDLGRDVIRREFEVNVFGAQDLTNRLIPLFREQGFGRIVNVSSVYGFVTAPLVGCYCASKYAMEAFSDAMRLELRRAGISVSLIEPGQIVTAFRRNAARLSQDRLDFEKGVFGKKYARKFKKVAEKDQQGSLFAKPPEAVAAKICHALESRRPRARYRVALPAHLAAFMQRFVPTSLVDRLLQNSARP